jgi:hypothetical protein
MFFYNHNEKFHDEFYDIAISNIDKAVLTILILEPMEAVIKNL